MGKPKKPPSVTYTAIEEFWVAGKSGGSVLLECVPVGQKELKGRLGTKSIGLMLRPAQLRVLAAAALQIADLLEDA